jgi:hypothetical protein
MSTQETTTKTKTANPKKAKANKKPAKAKKTANAKGAPKSGSKAAIVLELMRRKEGATLTEIAKATDCKITAFAGLSAGTLPRSSD